MQFFERKVGPETARNRSKLRPAYERKLFKLKKPAIFWRAFSLSTPERTRTPNLLVRSQTLYPIELQAHAYRYSIIEF